MRLQSKRHSKLTCFYCPAVLRGPQGRAAHIRAQHPRLPFHPTAEQILKYSEPPQQQGEILHTLSDKPADPPAAFSAAEIVHALHTNTAPMTPREHLATAISNLRSQLEALQQQIATLEALRQEEATIRLDMEALLKAEAAMQGNAREVVSK